MSLADMRKELKDLRKKAMPTPVSRMKKADCAAELARLKGLHHVEEKKVEAVLEKAEVPKKTAKKVEAVQKKEHKKQAEEPAVKKTKGVKAEPKKEEPKKETKPKAEKGSEEMKARMAKLREARKAKKKEE